jgi:hypothetical protein
MNDFRRRVFTRYKADRGPICEGLLFDAKLALGCHPKHLGDRPNLRSGPSLPGPGAAKRDVCA